MLYPFQFHTIFKDKIWGGQKIKTILNKDYAPLPNCGETWEISGVAGDVSVVKNGAFAQNTLTDLIQTHQHNLVGNKVWQRFGTNFPLLIKFIDANDDLSIQVHPDDALAMQRHNSYGKTEMWYVLQADPNATLIAGFNQDVSQELYLEKLHNNQLNDILNTEQVQADDVYFLPAGRVHTIGKGLLIAEIQQTSDITYRIYDFDRKDDQGNLRTLHTDLALDALDYKKHDNYRTAYAQKNNEPTEILTCAYFTTNKLIFDQKIHRNYDHIDSFVIYICTEGNATIETEQNTPLHITKGDTLLIPACLKNVVLKPSASAQILETFVP
jgi:mannose-6-phosphate isomerase